MTFLWYFHAPTPRILWDVLTDRDLRRWYGRGIFRNGPGIVPGRWGFFFYGFEFGSRNPRDPVGLWLKRRGLWPW